ncbi:MAG: hypothetical protein Q9218_006676 [Villophora microphyllina]
MMAYADALSKDEEVSNNCTSALADIKPNNEEVYEGWPFRQSSQTTQKAVKLLDGLALLLVRHSGEVCAITSIQTTNAVTVYWSKNSSLEIPVEDQEYLDGLLAAFQYQKKKFHILEMVGRNCMSKILSRCLKASKQFTTKSDQKNVLQIETAHPSYESLQKAFKTAGLVDDSFTLIDAFDWFIKNLLEVDNKSDLKIICQLICFADIATPKEDKYQHHQQPSVFNPTQLRYIQKIGAYRKAITSALSYCKGNGVKNLYRVHIPVPEPAQIQVYTRTQDALNTLYPYIPNKAGDVNPITNFKDVAYHFWGAKGGFGDEGQKHSIHATQHCVLTLALHFLEPTVKNSKDEKKRRTSPITIGSSKPLCHWCQHYIESLNRRHDVNRVITSRTDGKYVKGWLLPPGQEDTREDLLNEIGESVIGVFMEVAGYELIDDWDPTSWHKRKPCRSEWGCG